MKIKIIKKIAYYLLLGNLNFGGLTCNVAIIAPNIAINITMQASELKVNVIQKHKLIYKKITIYSSKKTAENISFAVLRHVDFKNIKK